MNILLTTTREIRLGMEWNLCLFRMSHNECFKILSVWIAPLLFLFTKVQAQLDAAIVLLLIKLKPKVACAIFVNSAR